MPTKKRKAQPTSQAQYALLKLILRKVKVNVNINTLVLGVATAWFTYKGTVMDEKQDKTMAWQHKRDSVNKIIVGEIREIKSLISDSLMRAKLIQ